VSNGKINYCKIRFLWPLEPRNGTLTVIAATSAKGASDAIVPSRHCEESMPPTVIARRSTFCSDVAISGIQGVLGSAKERLPRPFQGLAMTVPRRARLPHPSLRGVPKARRGNLWYLGPEKERLPRTLRVLAMTRKRAEPRNDKRERKPRNSGT